MSYDQQGFEMPNQSVFDQRMDSMADELREMRSAVSKVAEALTKLSVLEERNATTNQAIEKIAQRQDKAEEKVASLELGQVKFESNAKGMATAVLGRLRWRRAVYRLGTDQAVCSLIWS
jgi:septation ring formation regulator EzrA